MIVPSQKRSASRKDRGFTLVELMVTVSVAAILATIGIPAFTGMINSNRVTATTNELVTALNLAKSEAIRSGSNSIICKLNDTGDGCNNAGNWSNGWLLFNDSNNDGALDGGERIVRVHGAPEASLNFTFINTVNADNTINFRPNGTSNVNGRFCLENGYQAENSRAVVIKQSGRINAEVRKSTNNCESA